MCGTNWWFRDFRVLTLHSISLFLRCDLYGDGDYRLVVADQDRKLKVREGQGDEDERPGSG